MDPKILTEDGWKAVVQKFKLKDKDLQKALFFYENLEDDDFEFRLKGIAKVSSLASALKKDKEVVANAPVVKYLADMINASQTAQRDIAKEKAEAEKAKAQAAKNLAANQKKEDAEAKKDQEEEEEGGAGAEEDEEEEEEGDALKKLTTSLKTLKLSKKPYYFLVCDAKPYGLMVSKKDIRKSMQAKKELAQLAGGSTRPPKFGECRFENGKIVFEMEKPPSGLARILQKWIKDSTGLGLKVMVGTESSEDEQSPPLTGASPEPNRPGTSAGATASPAKPASAAEPAKPAGGPFSISATVGRGGENKPEDVTAVQTALNTRAKAGLKVDGKCGPKTFAAIEAFQKTLGQNKPDGRIEPGRAAARALASTGPLPKPPPAPQPAAPPKLGKPALSKAPEVWGGMRSFVDKNVDELKKAIRGHYGNEHPQLLEEIEKGLSKLDVIVDKLDHRLADSLAKAASAKDETGRTTELKKSKAILAEYINYVKSEPLITHIDGNPFGVDTQLGKTIKEHLVHVAQAIG